MSKSVFVLPVVLSVLAACGEGMTPEERAQRDCDDSGLAYIFSQDMIANRLRSPSTAKFPSRNQSDVRLFNQGECLHLISSYVDAQNGFGATTRTKFVAEIRFNKAFGSYTLESLVFE